MRHLTCGKYVRENNLHGFDRNTYKEEIVITRPQHRRNNTETEKKRSEDVEWIHVADDLKHSWYEA